MLEDIKGTLENVQLHRYKSRQTDNLLPLLSLEKWEAVLLAADVFKMLRLV